MALFRRKKKEEKHVESEAVPTPVKSTAHVRGDYSHVLRSPRITEKASSQMEIGVYTFDVSPDATKGSVAQAVSAIYKVRPRMVRIVSVRRKIRRNARTGAYGTSRGGKKAYVYLKQGDSITLA